MGEAIITEGKNIVRFIITKNNVGYSPAFKEMFKTLRNEIKNVDIIAEHGTRPLIKVRKNAGSIAKGSPSRKKEKNFQRDPFLLQILSWIKPSFSLNSSSLSLPFPFPVSIYATEQGTGKN